MHSTCTPLAFSVLHAVLERVQPEPFAHRCFVEIHLRWILPDTIPTSLLQAESVRSFHSPMLGASTWTSDGSNC